MTKREEHIQKLDKARAELIHAGPIHARDLQKYIRRMERQLMEYDNYRYDAKKAVSE